MTRVGMEIIDGVEIIDHPGLPRVEIEDVLEAVNAARVSAGWEPIAFLPKGRIGIRKSPVALALHCAVAEHSAWMEDLPIFHFNSAWGTPGHGDPENWRTHALLDSLHGFRISLPEVLITFGFQFDAGWFPEYVDPFGTDWNQDEDDGAGQL